MTSVIEFDNVSVNRGSKQILDSVNWRAQADERWVLLGRNGAGKTTLLQIAGGLMFPSRGTARILGEQLGRVDVFELRPRIGLCSAALSARIPDYEKARDVILTAAYAVTGRWREEYDEVDIARAQDLMNLFEIDHLADRVYGTLSEGERKRVQISRALMADPELLLLDEPSAGLDLGAREELLAALTEIARDPKSPAIVLVTHHVEEIPEGFTHGLLIKDGHVSATGRLDDVMTSENLSEAFGLQLEISRHGQRFSAHATQ
ncbi:ABC transporter ATP-binding protein [Rarobacter faecitabidus]|uniref:Iron complex transport system ATP-binding protein n=1 Tax=Rarobacter faecitabidus TaxID=13243 RepID=A0A542ZVH0_RARFA|nr:ABC transporter ATP-binding protein [Rarobacter faecitabidus]TQL64357.1 iron complex transport system ATP-binding protein [Rarobacter faecitabidus]